MRKFDTKVQHLKYKVLREVARQAWRDTLLDNVLDIRAILRLCVAVYIKSARFLPTA